MATLLTKGLIVAGGLVGTSFAAGGVYYLTSKDDSKTEEENIPSTSAENTSSLTTIDPAKTKSISELLKGKVLLTKAEGDNGKWNTPWGEFKTAHNSKAPESPWKFTDWKINGNNETNLESFKEQCLKLGKQKVSDTNDPVYIAVEKYCTKVAAKQAGDV